MVEVENIRVRTPSLDYMFVEWDISPTNEDIHDYYTYILRSENVGGPWDTLAGPIEDKYRYIDGSVNLRYKYRKYYYKIKLASKADPDDVYTSKVTATEFLPSLEALEIQRLERLYFNTHVGRKVLIFPVKTSGQRCLCFDTELNKKIKSFCLECFDTTFTRGYLNPIRVPMQIDPSPREVYRGQNSERDISFTAARTTNFPYIKPRDLIVEPLENRRWNVVKVTPTERLRVTVRQELALAELDRSNIEYQIPLEVDIFEFEPNEAHHYTYATCPENASTGKLQNAAF